MNLNQAPKTQTVRRVSIDNTTLDLGDDAPPEAQREAQPEKELEQTQETTTNTNKTKTEINIC